MATTGTRLFKLASQLNLGKETIVAFLESKGFNVENKATTSLTEEMTELVLGNFQKELNAAEKHRPKTPAPAKTPELAIEEPQATLVHEAPVSEKASATANHDTRADAKKEAETGPLVAAPAEAENVHIAEELPKQHSKSSKQADGVVVGTVISLDGLSSSRRSGKSKKAEPEAESAKAEAKSKAEKSSKKPVSEKDFIAEEPVAELVSETQENTIPLGSTQAIDKESAAPAVESPAEAGSVDASQAGEQHGSESGDAEGKKKRRRKIGEIEYAATGNYASQIVAPSLTILGKIDLNEQKRAAAQQTRKDSTKSSGKPSGGATGGANKPPVKVKGVTAKAPLRTDDDASRGPKKKRKKGKREQVNAADVDRAIRRTLSGGEDSAIAMRSRARQRRRAERAEQEERDAELRELEDSILRVTEFVTVAELANIMGVPTNEVIMKCMGLGLMVSINQRLETDTIQLIADDYGFTVEFEDAFNEEEVEEEEDEPESLRARAPIVTVMGHVDHGKTSLLDYIRQTSVVRGESGGITQHIGAYSVKMKDGKFITFLDTPGHQAFTAMRARGAQVTDIVVLVVAADDSVMPQTMEAISHARAANVPMIVAINKIDKPEANPDRIRQQLADQNVLVEEWGGKFQSVEISAKKGLNIEQMLEKILLEAEILHLQANPERLARAAVVEAKIDKGKGPVATVIVQKGTLRVGDPFVTGIYAGRVRAMLDEKGDRVEVAIPSTPVQLLGLDGVPQAGDSLIAMKSESAAKDLANRRQQIKREQDFKQIRHVTLDDLAQRIESGGMQELRIILKADTDGSMEALSDSLQKLSTPEVSVQIILRAVGPISESDVMLAAASDAIIVGFHVRPNPQIAKLAENEGVDIRLYRIIYDCINEIKLALEGMLRPEIKEEVAGVAEIREIFRISKLGNIAGCYMLEGKINRNDTVRVLRDGFEVYTNGKISSLKRMKDDVREVDAGFECGISVEGFNDIKVGDLIEAVRKTEVKRKL